ncbi:uncharacterized protein LOC134066110 [Sardina pilchardus]|uniref:uncharacterized protein LOC134066110 n=1 Tax=Sardina pilchardus TaxID=27697 RepID=UPI002E1271C8
MDVLFMVVALVLTLGMAEAATPLEIFTHDHGSNIHLKCLTNKSDQWIDLMWYRTSETGFEYIGHTELQGKEEYKYQINGSNKHIRLHRTIDTFNLSITDVQPSDSGAYCCMRGTSGTKILNVAVLLVKETSPTGSTSVVATTDDSQNEKNSTQGPGCQEERTDLKLLKALGGSLVLCVGLIVFLGYLSFKRRECKHCKEKACQVQQDTHLSNQNSWQDDETLNYAPVHFAKRGEQQKKKQKKKTTQPEEETLYAGVKCS